MIRREKKRVILIATVLLTVVLLVATAPASSAINGGCIEVNKTVYNPETGEWTKTRLANMNDTLQFKCTIHNCGPVNLTHVRFWDVLDCSLKCLPQLKINDTGINITDDDGPDYRFKPKVLHPATDWILSKPWNAQFTEFCPNVGTHRQIVGWDDTYNIGNVSACDQIQLSSGVPYYWYHVDRVSYTLNMSIVNMTVGNATRYFDSALNWNEVDLANPNGTVWFQVCSCKDRYTLIEWRDRINDSVFGPGDLVTMLNERTGSEVLYIVDQAPQKDLVVSREYELNDYFGGDPLVLDPGETISVEYNATVVRRGVDNNTFQAKGSYDKSWYYSNEDRVTIMVPSQSGFAIDPNGLMKEVYTWGEPIYAMGSGFPPNKSVDIYITRARRWANGDIIAKFAIVGPVNTITDAMGNIGPVRIDPELTYVDSGLGASICKAGLHLVFDDDQGTWYQFEDAFDEFEIRGTAVPLVTPLGIVALLVLLSLIATSTIVVKKRL